MGGGLKTHGRALCCTERLFTERVEEGKQMSFRSDSRVIPFWLSELVS